MSTLLHKLDRNRQMNECVAMIREFSIQIMQEKYKFSVNGFFSLSYEFLGAVSVTINFNIFYLI